MRQEVNPVALSVACKNYAQECMHGWWPKTMRAIMWTLMAIYWELVACRLDRRKG